MTIEIGQKILASDVVSTLTKIASAVLQNSDDTERYRYAANYTKTKEIKVNESYSGTMRIMFDLKGNGATNGYARIYKNGIAIGTERIRFLNSYETYSEDFSLSLIANDLLQIYIKGTTYVRNMRLYYSNILTAIGQDVLETEILVTCSAISTTNQDP